MSRGLVFSPDYNLITTCWMAQAGLFGRNCDVLLMTQDAGRAERLEKAGFFHKVFLFTDRNQHGNTLSRLDSAIDSLLRGPTRPFRRKADYMEFLSPSRFYDPETSDWDCYYAHTTGFEMFFPQLKRVLWRKGAVSFWEHALFHSVKGGQSRVLPSFYFAEAQSLWLGLSGITHPRDQLSEMIVSLPELVPDVCRARAEIRAMPKIDKTDLSFRRAMNDVFATGGEGFFPQTLFFPGSVGALQRFQPNEQRFLDGAAAILGEDAITVKEHPGSVYDKRPPWRGVKLLPDSGLPFELQILNHDGWDGRLLIAPYCTTALLTPKAFFDEEPFILNLTRLFPEFNQDSWTGLNLELAGEAGGLYRNPEKYCIPKTWDEVWDFLRAFKQQTFRAAFLTAPISER